MKKLFIAIIFAPLLLLGCNPVPTPLALPITTIVTTPVPTFTPEPSPTSVPTLRPSLHIGSQSLIHVNSMTRVSEPDATISVWTVGDDGFVSHISQDGYIKRIDSPAREMLYDVDFVSPEDGWIVGANGLIMHWNGTAWQVSQPAQNSRWPYSSDLYRVAFTKADDGWAAGCTGSEGGEYFLLYHWDGNTWSEVKMSEEPSLWACVHDMLALSHDDVWLVGTGWNDGKEYGITGNGIVLQWNGAEWAEQAQLEAANLIFARNVNDVFAVGTRIWHWDGSVWNDISSSSNFPGDAEIKSILTPYDAESGEPVLWLLDASGQIYSFSLPQPRPN